MGYTMVRGGGGDEEEGNCLKCKSHSFLQGCLALIIATLHGVHAYAAFSSSVTAAPAARAPDLMSEEVTPAGTGRDDVNTGGMRRSLLQTLPPPQTPPPPSPGFNLLPQLAEVVPILSIHVPGTRKYLMAERPLANNHPGMGTAIHQGVWTLNHALPCIIFPFS